jgi:hypothetical protein
MLQALEGANQRFVLRSRLSMLSVRVAVLVGADVKHVNFTRGALGGRLKRLEQSEPAQFGVVNAHHDHIRLLGQTHRYLGDSRSISESGRARDLLMQTTCQSLAGNFPHEAAKPSPTTESKRHGVSK